MAGNKNSGRRPISAEVKRFLEREGRKSLDVMVAIRDDKEASYAVRLDAANKIVEQAFGKATQKTELTGENGSPLITQVVIGVQDATLPGDSK
jgi:hypothetical protein